MISTGDYTEIVLFGVFGILLGGVVEFVLRRFHLPIPYTVLVFYSGILLAAIITLFGYEFADFVKDPTIASDLIVYGFLPALLFGETMNLNLHHTQKGFAQSVILAGVGGVIVCFELGVLAFATLPFGWSWVQAFLFGSILCATDPVSVVGLLKSARASSKLTTIVSGESLLNDGSAMTLYFFFMHLVQGYTYTAGSLILFIFEMIILSPAIGLVIGYITYRIMKKFTRPTNLNMDIQIIITIVCGYSSFAVAEGPLKVSGVLACVASGVTLALLVSPKLLYHEKMHEVWSAIEWICNTLIFLLGGLIGGIHSLGLVTIQNICYLFLMYVFLVVTRYVMVFSLFPIVSRIGMKCDFTDAIFVGFAGLRGALAIALALVAASEDSDDGSSDFGSQLFFFVTGLVSMTLLINGSTAGMVLLGLRLIENPDAKPSAQLQQVLDRIKVSLREVVREEMSGMKQELGDYDAREVSRLCHSMGDIDVLDDNISRFGRDASSDSLSSDVVLAAVEPDDREAQRSMRASGTMDADNDLLAYVRSTFLETIRSRYLESIESGKIGSSAFSAKLLLYSVDKAMDTVKTRLSDLEHIQAFLKPNKYYLGFCQAVDNFFHCTLNAYPGLVSKLDARTERVAIYSLINYIDAHEYAQSQMHYFLGGPQSEAVFDIAGPEESTVRRESELLVEKAKFLLRSIDQNDVKQIYTHRAAMAIIMRQTEILDRMIKEGSIAARDARHLFKTIEKDRRRLDTERHQYDRGIVSETQMKKLTQEKEQRSSLVRNSLGGGQDNNTSGTVTPVPRESMTRGGAGGGGAEEELPRRPSFREKNDDTLSTPTAPIRIRKKAAAERESESAPVTPVNSPPQDSSVVNPLVGRARPPSPPPLPGQTGDINNQVSSDNNDGNSV